MAKQRNKTKRVISEKNKISPEDYEGFDYGPLKVERIGRFIRMISHWDPEEFEKFREKVRSERPKFKKEINKKIDEILSLIRQFEPLELLATISVKNCFADPEEYKETTYEGRECYVEYALSLILSQKCKKEMPHATKEMIENFNSLLAEIFNDVLWYFGSEAAEDKRNEFEEELRFISILRFLFVRGDSFPEHHINMIKEIFSSHDVFLKKHYGFSSSHIISGIQEIEKQLLDNIWKYTEVMVLLYDLHEVFKKFVDKEGMDSFSSIEDCRDKYLALSIVQEKKEKLEEIQYDINRNPFEISPTKSLPVELLKLLSSHFGDNSSFANLKKYPAWPTNDTVIYNRPLIETDGKFYCFCPQLLFRNIGNILESWIQNKDSSYYQSIYQKKRAEYLENKALEYLKNIFPTAKIFGKLFYYIEEDGKRKRVETDGLILYDENLFIIEAKAGRLSTSARRGSLERMKRDVSDLVDNAYKQSLRTKQYIMDIPEPIFEYEDGSKALVLENKAKYKNIYLFNITFQNLAHLSIRLNSIRRFNLIEGKEWPWSVFINDLRVISELIEFPSEFLHFLQRRIKANDYPQFYTTDELDFLMFYFYEGLYFEDSELKNLDRYIPYAYTEDLDRYYDYLAGRVSSGKKPRLKISDGYKNLIREIEATGKYRFTKVTTTLLSFDSETQQAILNGIRKAKEALIKDGKDHDFTMYFKGLKMGLMFYVSTSRSPDFWDRIDRHCKLKMYQTRFKEWILVTIDIDENSNQFFDFRVYNQK